MIVRCRQLNQVQMDLRLPRLPVVRMQDRSSHPLELCEDVQKGLQSHVGECKAICHDQMPRVLEYDALGLDASISSGNALQFHLLGAMELSHLDHVVHIPWRVQSHAGPPGQATCKLLRICSKL